MSSKDFIKKYGKDWNVKNNGSNEGGRSNHKYRNNKCEWTGQWRGRSITVKFDSFAERDYGISLISRERVGEIEQLDFQKRFPLVPKIKDERAVAYVSDYYYFDIKLKVFVVEDKKSEITKKEPRYIIKRKLFKWLYPDILFREV